MVLPLAVSDGPAATWTVQELLTWTRGHLAGALLDEARLAAEILLAHALDCERIELYTRFDYHPAPEELACFRGLIRRARDGEPVAYLVGHKEFYSLSFKVTPDVLVPRPETELLAAEAVVRLRELRRPARVWDVCTGCGCVGVAVARQVAAAAVLATDISPQAVAVAAENARAHSLDERVLCRTADLLTLPGDWDGPPQFDVITANPPYVAEGDDVAPAVRHEPARALYAGPDGLDVIRPLVTAAGRFLATGGALAMEFGADQADAVRDLIAATGAFHEPRILRDHHHVERTAVATRK